MGQKAEVYRGVAIILAKNGNYYFRIYVGTGWRTVSNLTWLADARKAIDDIKERSNGRNN